ncbi:MAG: hypothetical protein ACR2QW_09785 [bacterium]
MMEQLDRDILEWIAGETGDKALTDQIGQASVSKRDYMRTGFFVYFEVPDDVAMLPEGLRPICPHIQSDELLDGGGCDLFLRNGRLHYLEIYARGGFFPERLEYYELKLAG